MAEKKLLMYQNEDEGDKDITYLTGDPTNETIYAITEYSNNGDLGEDVVELAVSVEDMIKMRDFLNRIISKVGPAGEYTDDNIFIKAHEMEAD